jgi:hypothetical protein
VNQNVDLFVPVVELFGIFGFEEDTADAGDASHKTTLSPTVLMVSAFCSFLEFLARAKPAEAFPGKPVRC